jgi:hypothetical protein
MGSIHFRKHTRQFTSPNRIIEKHDVKAVLHFAASAYADESISANRAYFLSKMRIDYSNCLAMAGISDVAGSTEGVGAGASMAGPSGSSDPLPSRPILAHLRTESATSHSGITLLAIIECFQRGFSRIDLIVGRLLRAYVLTEAQGRGL